jgi:tetratricopeptide (TPR) repeat protein
MNRSQFRLLIQKHFDLEELRTLCFDVHVDYDSLRGEGKEAKVRELVATMHRNGRLPELVTALSQRRPHVPWHDVLATTPPTELLPAWPGQIAKPYWIAGVALLTVLLVAVALVYSRTGTNRRDTAAMATRTASFQAPLLDTAVPTNTNTPTHTATPYPTPTVTPTIATSPTPIATPGPVGEYIILVARLEPIGVPERDVTRFIADDLRQRLAVVAPFSRIRVRQYPQIITTDAEAAVVAEQFGAAVVIWGNYTAGFIEMDVQVGSLQGFSQIPFTPELLARTVNVRVRMNDERQESIAQRVLAILVVLEMASSNAHRVGQLTIIQNEIQATPARLIGQSAAVHLHNYADFLYHDGILALAEINAALRQQADNPLLYVQRGHIQARLGNLAAAERDLTTAERLSPEWVFPHAIRGFWLLLQDDYQATIDAYSLVAAQRPQDWFPLYMQGMAFFLAGEYAQARERLDQAIDLEPDVNWPYATAAQVALREGRIPDAVGLANVILQKFPDPTFGNRIIQALVGEESGLGLLISAFGNGLLGQYETMRDEVERSLTFMDDLADLYWMQGFAYCNLRDYDVAEAAYTEGIELAPDFILLYLSRAETRLKQGNTTGAAEDFAIIGNSQLAEQFSDAVLGVQFGFLTCHNYLTFQP